MSSPPSSPSPPSSSPASTRLPDSPADDVLGPPPRSRVSTIESKLQGDSDPDTSWRSRGSDETDASHATQGSNQTQGTLGSIVSASDSLDSTGSQDVEVITSPLQGTSPTNPASSYSRSTPSPFDASRYSYSNSYSESNPYAFSYPLQPKSPLTNDSTYPCSPASNDTPNLESTSNDFASNAAVISPASKRELLSSAPASTAISNSVSLFPDSNTALNATAFDALSQPTPVTSPSASTPQPSLALPRRENASIPIINPVDRSVVRTPMPPKPSRAAPAGVLTVAENNTDVTSAPSLDVPAASPPAFSSDSVHPDVGDTTVVPSPTLSPKVPASSTAASDPDSALTVGGEVLYCAKPPIVLPAPGVLGKGDVTLGPNGTINGYSVSSSSPTCVPVHIGLTPSVSSVSISSSASASAFKSPNVYVNGLPPYYPEDDLLALASPFGGVRSVRSFTRHVGGDGDGVKKASGYGFVLFDSIDSAERCIEGLRQYKNLHPSFSKQAHKIPGTPYTNMQNNCPPALPESPDDEAQVVPSNDPEEGSVPSDDRESFKARMERLGDRNSTNVYIEGLPLSIDENTLAALVSPYSIKSCRFFQTKLSHPPRIIAFVRLETRQGAEEIIERLHGRMVRGWNDTGSRISARFADTAEQRELRRNERVVRAGDQPTDQSSARLTIAQAALLNLHGQELRNQVCNPEIGRTVFDHKSTTSGLPSSMASMVGGFSSSRLPLSAASLGGIPASIARARLDRMNLKAGVAANSNSASSGNAMGVNLSESLYMRNRSGDSFTPLSSTHLIGAGPYEIDTNMQYGIDQFHLLQQGNPQVQRDLCRADLRYAHGGSDHYQAQPQLQEIPSHARGHPTIGRTLGAGLNSLGTGGGMEFNELSGMGIGLERTSQAAQSRNGYTPTEELILRAHQARSQHLQPHGRPHPQPFLQLQSRPSASRSQRSGKDHRLGSRSSQRGGSSAKGWGRQHETSRMDYEMNEEDEFHARVSQSMQQELRPEHNSTVDQVTSATVERHESMSSSPGLSSYTFSHVPSQPPLPSQAHMRSTTVPHHPAVGNQSGAPNQRHHQHSSINIPHSSLMTTAPGYSQSLNNNDDFSNSRSTIQNRSTKYTSITNTHEDNNGPGSDRDNKSTNTSKNSTSRYTHISSIAANKRNYDELAPKNRSNPEMEAYDGDVESSGTGRGDQARLERSGKNQGSPDSNASPALTYSAHTPSTLSPSTPYFGSFGNSHIQVEGQRGNDQVIGGGHGKPVEVNMVPTPIGGTTGKKGKGERHGGGGRQSTKNNKSVKSAGR